MKIANIKKLDIANGDGLRTSVFVSGCRLHCKGCFNYQAWDFNYGEELNSTKLIEIIDSCKGNNIKGLSILGGEPLDENNQEGVSLIVNFFRDTFSNPESTFYNPNKDIWLWTGYTYNYNIPQTLFTNKILMNIDYLIDGQYDDSLRNLNLKYRGSSNQRVLYNKNKSGEFTQIIVD